MLGCYGGWQKSWVWGREREWDRKRGMERYGERGGGMWRGGWGGEGERDREREREREKGWGGLMNR